QELRVGPVGGDGASRADNLEAGVALGRMGPVWRAPHDDGANTTVTEPQRERRQVVDAGCAVQAVEVGADHGVDGRYLAAHRVAGGANPVAAEVQQLAPDPPIRMVGFAVPTGRANVGLVTGAVA